MHTNALSICCLKNLMLFHTIGNDRLANHSEIIDTDPELRNDGYGKFGKFSIIIPAFVLK